MGKAIPKNIKMRTRKVLQLIGDKFSKNFEENKAVIRKLKLPFSKIEQNLMAGYIVRLKKAQAAKEAA